jgi:hypothetical protein
MTEPEFDAFMEISMQDQARGQVQAGTRQAEEAEALLKKQLEMMAKELVRKLGDLTKTCVPFWANRSRTSVRTRRRTHGSAEQLCLF